MRVVERHHHGRTASTPEEVVRSVAALHSTDPATPYISSRARVPGLDIENLESALYEDRSLIRMHSIRRTLFLFDIEDAVWFHAGATREIAVKERARFEMSLTASMPEHEVAPFVERLTGEVRQVLSGRTLSTSEIIAAVPDLARKIEIGSGKWVNSVPVGTRLLLVLGMEGFMVRARPVGTWKSSQYRWALTEEWLGRPIPAVDATEARASLLRRYLEGHGPATLTDIRWWTGWTARFSKEALVAVDAIEVSLEDGSVGYQLADDPGAGGVTEEVVAFLPSLDSSTMGWKERSWYLGPHGDEVFDSIGNAGPTIWVGGRIVGGWGQKPDGTVVYEILEDVPKRTASSIADEAKALGEWLGERVVMPRFPSPLGKRLAQQE